MKQSPLIIALVATAVSMAYADWTTLTTKEHGQDAFVAENHATTAFEDKQPSFLLRGRFANLNPGGWAHQVPVLGFNLETVVGTINDARLRLFVSVASGQSFNIEVYGLVDDKERDFWKSPMLTYALAPWVKQVDGDPQTNDHKEGATVLLGVIKYTRNLSGPLSFTSPELFRFLKSDTNRRVTLILEPQIIEGSDHYIQIISAANRELHEEEFYPSLDVLTVAAPAFQE